MQSWTGHFWPSWDHRFSQEGLEIASLDAPLRPDPKRDQAAFGDPATDCLVADLHQIRRLADRQQRLKRTGRWTKCPRHQDAPEQIGVPPMATASERSADREKPGKADGYLISGFAAISILRVA
jgi:hypothetical protein